MTIRMKILARESLRNRIIQDEANGLSFEQIKEKYADKGAVHT